MQKIDLTKLTEMQLIELQKMVEEERKNRDHKILYKSNYGFDSEEAYTKVEKSIFNEFVRNSKDEFISHDDYRWRHATIDKVPDTLFFLCDILTGNFNAKYDRDGRVTSFRRETHMILASRSEKEREDYHELFNAFMKTIMDFVDKKEDSK